MGIGGVEGRTARSVNSFEESIYMQSEKMSSPHLRPEIPPAPVVGCESEQKSKKAKEQKSSWVLHFEIDVQPIQEPRC